MKPGILKDVPMSDYIADKLGDSPTLSSGIANILLTQSPRHAWVAHPRLNPAYEAEESKPADIGSAAHEILLGNESRIVVVQAADWRTNAAKDARDAAYATGGIPILIEKMQQVSNMVTTARLYIEGSEIAGIFDDGAAEQTILWQEMFLARAGEKKGRRQDGVWCRARPDWLSGNRKTMLHYKTTTGSANQRTWIRSHLEEDGYDLSVALYERGLGMFEQKGELVSVILVQEQNPPYACSLVGLDPSLREFAHRKVNAAINLWADCLAKNEWPAYSNRIAWAAPQPWQQAAWEEREMIEQMERQVTDKTPYGEQG